MAASRAFPFLHKTQTDVPRFNFLSFHYAYFILMGLVGGLIFWAAATPLRSVSYADSLFLATSAMTGAGLNTLNLSTLNSFQQAMLFSLILLGHPILISSTILFIRMRAFESRFKHALEYKANQTGTRQADMRTQHHHIAIGVPSKPTGDGLFIDQGAEEPSDRNGGVSIPEKFPNDQIGSARDSINHNHTSSATEIAVKPDYKAPGNAMPLSSMFTTPTNIPSSFGTQKFFSFVSRNSEFYGLTLAEREELGGVEYKAVSFLAVVVLLYFLLFNILGLIGLGCWLARNRPSVARVNGLSPFWTGAFFGVSAFGNNGMSLLDENMTVLNTSAYMLLTMGFLILSGNTLYPCVLRFIIWAMRQMLPSSGTWKDWKDVLDFVLKHPRRVYTHLFPAHHTWYLLGTIILLNGLDWAGFELLAIGNPKIQELGTWRVLDGLFQAFAVRAGGFYVVNIANLRQGLLVLYTLMMYVSAFPVLLTIRNTNVYEERSLGLYVGDHLADDQRHRTARSGFFSSFKRLLGKRHSGIPSTPKDTWHSFFLQQQLRYQLSQDIWWICLAVLFISIIESSNYDRDPVAFSTFNIIFEVVSAYGCVGISVGTPNENYSFCGSWHVLSKLILVGMMLRGRHRGLPVAIDKAVMLPHEALAQAEEEDAAIRLQASIRCAPIETDFINV